LYHPDIIYSAAHQYRNFGDDIKGLAENLNNITNVVENAKITWAQHSLRMGRSRFSPVQKDWDFSSLREIIGDYHKTLADCKTLLEENHEFRKNRNAAYNIEWNVVIQPKVDHLRKRLESHNSKISILLKPLELNLFAEIHKDLADRIDAVHRSILHLQGLLIPDVEQAILEQGHSVPITLTVPPEIETKFQTAAVKAHPEIRLHGGFPLQAGADAFVSHFDQSTKGFTAGNFLKERVPEPKQYLELLKCIWLINGIKDSKDLQNQDKDSQWPGYVDQLNENLSLECQRFTTPSSQRLVAPVLNNGLADEDYQIWSGENIADYISPHEEACLDEVLRISLPCPSEELKRDLTIYRLESTKYRLVESIEDTSAASALSQNFKMDIDLRTVVLTPIYATPSSRQKSLELLVHSGTTKLTPTFQEHKHVLRLQHLLTGYKVYDRYDQAMVTVSFKISGQDNPIQEHGRLQLWLPHPFESSSTANSVITNLVQGSAPTFGSPSQSKECVTPETSRVDTNFTRASKTSSRSSLNTNRDIKSLNSRHSRLNMSSSMLSLSSVASKHHSPSIMTTSSAFSRSTVSTITTISTGTGRGHLHSKPAKPLLVIFLKSQDETANLATVAIQMDDLTQVMRERCQCRNANSDCRISCIERSSGNLMIQRWNADQGLLSWNLAMLGQEQRKELPQYAWNSVKRVSFKFESFEGTQSYFLWFSFAIMLTEFSDRYKFSGGPCSCKPRLQHELASCVRDMHRGIFGIVKQIGTQRLQNYHNEREKAAGRNIVEGPLTEEWL